MFNFVELSEMHHDHEGNQVQESLFDVDSQDDNSPQISLIGFDTNRHNDYPRTTSNRESVPMTNPNQASFFPVDEFLRDFRMKEEENLAFQKQEPGSLRTSITQAVPRRSPRESLQVLVADNRIKKSTQKHLNCNAQSSKVDQSVERTQESLKVKKKRSKRNINKARCNCNKTKCLKLYCECFAAGRVCNNKCRCVNCHNREEMQELRELVIKETVEKNPLAFISKFKKIDEKNINKLHSRGCNCQKTGCVKNYCECFRGGIGCSPLCNCTGCKNECLQVEFNEVAPYKDKVLRKRKKRNFLFDVFLNKPGFQKD